MKLHPHNIIFCRLVVLKQEAHYLYPRAFLLNQLSREREELFPLNLCLKQVLLYLNLYKTNIQFNIQGVFGWEEIERKERKEFRGMKDSLFGQQRIEGEELEEQMIIFIKVSISSKVENIDWKTFISLFLPSLPFLTNTSYFSLISLFVSFSFLPSSSLLLFFLQNQNCYPNSVNENFDRNHL